MTPLHIAGVENTMTDIPSHSFDSELKWFCKDDSDLLQLLNNKIPPTNQASWTVLHPSSAASMKVLYVLRMQDSTMGNIGNIGVVLPLVNFRL